MFKVYKFGVFLILVLITSCVSIDSKGPVLNGVKEPAQVLVYRQWRFSSGGLDLYFGEDGKYFLNLKNRQYSKLLIESGNHTFQVKGQSGLSYELKVHLKPGTTTCLRAKRNVKRNVGSIIPLVSLALSNFVLRSFK